MWVYEKRLQVPVDIKKRDLRMAKYVLSALGGTDGELNASMEYLHQRYAMPTDMSRSILTDIGTEELAHLEIVHALVYQLTEGATDAEIKESGLGNSFSLHGLGVFPSDPNGTPWSSSTVAVTGDPIADMNANLAAEQKARAGYEHLLNLSDDEDVRKVLRYLREREIVHFQRFGETLNSLQDFYDNDHYFYMKK